MLQFGLKRKGKLYGSIQTYACVFHALCDNSLNPALKLMSQQKSHPISFFRRCSAMAFTILILGKVYVKELPFIFYSFYISLPPWDKIHVVHCPMLLGASTPLHCGEWVYRETYLTTGTVKGGKWVWIIDFYLLKKDRLHTRNSDAIFAWWMCFYKRRFL